MRFDEVCMLLEGLGWSRAGCYDEISVNACEGAVFGRIMCIYSSVYTVGKILIVFCFHSIECV